MKWGDYIKGPKAVNKPAFRRHLQQRSAAAMSRLGNGIYLDAAAGIAGDMMLAALLDLGLPESAVLGPLRASLPPFSWTLHRVRTRGLAASRLEVAPLETDPPARTLTEIERIIAEGTWPAEVKQTATRVFRLLGEAEARIHGIGLDRIHFHEVGALDSLVDVIGTVLAVHLLAPSSLTVSSLPLGSGTVRTDHGLYPVPAPATLELMTGVPTHPLPVAREVSTPTGVALARVLADGFGPAPAGQIVAIGYGAGTREAAANELPNVLRAWSYTPALAGHGCQQILVLESNLDHVSGEDAGHLVESLMAAGALDAFLIPTIQKKSRPGLLVTALAEADSVDRLERVIFELSGTLGVRRRVCERRALVRSVETVDLDGTPVRVKCAYLDGVRLDARPEFEDLKRLSAATQEPIRRLRERVVRALPPEPRAGA